MRPTKSHSWFKSFAKATSRVTGRPKAFVLAAGVILVWLATGPLFGYSDTWQLVINTGTTIVTFLMVFLIQNTQNRDCRGGAGETGRAAPGDDRARTTRCWISKSSRTASWTGFGADTHAWPSAPARISDRAEPIPGSVS